LAPEVSSDATGIVLYQNRADAVQPPLRRAVAVSAHQPVAHIMFPASAGENPQRTATRQPKIGRLAANTISPEIGAPKAE
jgi:hypothetical protein